LISKKQEQGEKSSSLAESNDFFSNLNRRFFKKSEKKEGGEGERERERVVVVVQRKAQSRAHTQRERENERGDVRLFYDKNSLD